MAQSDAPDIIKYFYEEPAALEAVAADDDADARRREAPQMSLEAFLGSRRYYRGYMAGTSLGHDAVGLTAVPQRAALLELLMGLRGGRPLSIWTKETAEPLRDPLLLVERPHEVLVAVFGDAPLDLSTVTALAAEHRRPALGFLQGILNQGMPILFPEPAHQGTDWSVFSPFPLVENVRRAMSRIAGPGLRTFAIPHAKARSEEKFYFERYDVELFSEYEVVTE